MMASMVLKKSHHFYRVSQKVIQNLHSENTISGFVYNNVKTSFCRSTSYVPRQIFPYNFSTSTEGPSGEIKETTTERRRMLNRLLYRSRQRGYLELDLLLGNWAEENIEKLDDKQLSSLIEVLDLENPELWKWLTGQEPVPEFLVANPVFKAIHEKVMGALDTHAAAETRAKLGQPWVRGWDDNRKLGGPQVGNQ